MGNPVIAAIDAGHYQRSDGMLKGKCHTCGTAWPCDPFVEAEKAQTPIRVANNRRGFDTPTFAPSKPTGMYGR